MPTSLKGGRTFKAIQRLDSHTAGSGSFFIQVPQSKTEQVNSPLKREYFYRQYYSRREEYFNLLSKTNRERLVNKGQVMRSQVKCDLDLRWHTTEEDTHVEVMNVQTLVSGS